MLWTNEIALKKNAMKLFLAVVGLFFSASLFGQTTGTVTTTIHGNVSDAVTKKPIKEATVILYSNGAELQRVKTDNRGNYSFGELPAGIYDIKFESPDHLMQESKKLTLKASKRLRVAKLLKPKQTGSK